jgi:hypothetical protein
VDPARNAAAGLSPEADTVLSPRGATVTTLVVHAREDLEIAAEVRSLLHGEGASSPGERTEGPTRGR